VVGFGVFAGDADVFVLLVPISFASAEAGKGEVYHIEGNDIFEGDFAGFVLLNEDFVYFDG
jgi:hypothetical protein